MPQMQSGINDLSSSTILFTNKKHATDLADSIRFLGSSFLHDPSWTVCPNTFKRNITCIPSKDIIMRCRDHMLTNFSNTPAHIYYLKSFSSLEQNVITTRYFASALVWIFNFFCTTIMDDTLIKIFRLTFLCRFYSTMVVAIILLCISNDNPMTYFAQLLDISSPASYTLAMDHVIYAYGVGFIGIYDFGTLSPYTMVDNAVVLFTAMFTLNAFGRSLIVKILHVAMTNCVEIEISITPHYLLFAILPLSTEFFYAHKLYIIYVYVNLMMATISYLALLTLTMSKLLHTEFRSVKSMYIVGILCFLGFSLSVPITVQSSLSNSRIQGLMYGIKVTALYLGGSKVAIVMWIYGVKRFCTDIQFWLGFKPAKFWVVCWMFLPVVLFAFCLNRLFLLIQMRDVDFTLLITASIWIIFSLAVVELIHIRTVVKYIARNNLAKAFLSNSKYGPPDSDDRKQRKLYNETIQLRQCRHNCNVLYDTFDCNHLPLLHRNKSRVSETSSMTSIYSSGKRKHNSLIVESIE